MKTKIIAVTALGMVALTGTAQAAYGPEAPQPTDAPGGYSQVVTARTLSKAGGTLSGKSGKSGVSIRVPAGAFGGSVQFRLVAPKLSTLASAIKKSGFKGMTLAGVAVAQSGSSGGAIAKLTKPIKITLSVSKLPKDAYVLRYDAVRGDYVKTKFTVKNGKIVVSMARPVALVVVAPKH